MRAPHRRRRSRTAWRPLALDVLREEFLSYDRRLTVVRFGSARFAGRTLGETTIPESDRILVAVERAGRIITDVSLEFRFEADDSLLVAGDDEAIDALESGTESIPA